MDYIHHYQSPLGGITLASDGKALTGLWFDKQKYFADTLDKDFQEKDLPIFEQVSKWLDIYFSGKAPDFIQHHFARQYGKLCFLFLTVKR